MSSVPEVIRRTVALGNGAPHLLTPDIHAAIIDEVSLGATLKGAAALAGILPETADTWRMYGRRHASLPAEERNENNPYYRFYCDYRKARLSISAQGAKKWWRMATQPITKRTVVYREQPLFNEDGSVAIGEDGRPLMMKVIDKETVEETGEGSYTALQEYMARCFAEEDVEQKGWRKTDNVEVTGKDGDAIKVAHTVTLSPADLDDMSLEEKQALLSLMEKKAAAAALQAGDEVAGEWIEVSEPARDDLASARVPASLFDFD